MIRSEASRHAHSRLPIPFHRTIPPPTLITQGAEGHLFKTSFLTKATPAALKIRSSKAYRHSTLDRRLTKQRVLAEARVLLKLSNVGVTVPGVYAVDWDTESSDGASSVLDFADMNSLPQAKIGAWLLMEWIDGSSVRQLLRDRDGWIKAGVPSAYSSAATEAVRHLLQKVGSAVGRMHFIGGVVHGDLTSSNIMVRPSRSAISDFTNDTLVDTRQEEHPIPNLDGDVVLIDFGLATQSIQDEDRAVDLYVLEKAFGSTHPMQEHMFVEEVLESRDGYRGAFKGSQVVLKRLEEVRTRGRKRSMVG